MGRTEIEIFAPAKINLVLRVCGRRSDGYHEIETVMQKLDLADRLLLEKKSGSRDIILRCPGTDLPEGEDNLVFKAAVAFFNFTGILAGVRITLEKRIPVAAGLGGGSSDAAAALIGLNALFCADLPEDDLLGIAALIGADVPFFVSKKSAAYATGIGVTLHSIAPVTDCWIVLVNPGVSVSTKWAYDNFRLTTASKPYMFTGYSKSAQSEFPTGMSEMLARCEAEFPFNDLETVTARRYAVIQTIKDELLGQGACLAMMSGSGSTVFGLFSRQAEAVASCSAFKGLYSGVFLTRPI
jgi:4-diphosphocytidyl-2-C-methyl-D-erythritol kinase